MKAVKSIITLFFLSVACMLFAQDKCVEGDCKNGQGVFQWTDGAKYEGNFLNSEFEGEGTYYWTNGSKHTGLWNVGRRHGKGTHTAADGTVTTGVWNYGYIIKTSQSVEAAKSGDVEEKAYDMKLPDSEIIEEEMVKTEKGEAALVAKKTETLTESITLADALLGPELAITDPKPTDNLITTDGSSLIIKGYASDPGKVLCLWVNDRKVKLENGGENHTEFEIEIKLENDNEKILVEAINSEFDKSRKVYDVVKSAKKN